MSAQSPESPAGKGKHPVVLVVLAANDLAASNAFYSRVFGWKLQLMSAEVAAGFLPSGPMVALRAKVPAESQTMVPFIGVANVEEMLARVVSAGATIDRAPWSLPMVGKLARFKDPSGTVYGLTDAAPPGGSPHVPVPFGSNPKPPAGTICSLEMHATEGGVEPFFNNLFGWSVQSTMPRYTSFEPGAGVGGVFQSHTPALPALAYLYVANVASKLAEIDAASGKRQGEPMPVPGMGCFGYFTDPSGTTMGLIAP